MRAAIYVRVSTDEQAVSADEQERGARVWCERQGHVVERVYRDVGYSGAEWVTRPGVVDLERDARSTPRPWDVLVTRDADRLGRDAVRLPMLLRTITERGARVVEYSTGRTVELEGHALIVVAVMAAVAQVERENIARRVRGALAQKAQRGLVTGGKVYGYRNVRSDDGVHYEVDEAEAVIVRELYQRHAAGESARAIARALNARGVPSPRADGGGTGSWCMGTVLAILRSERYRGSATWGRVGSRYRDGSRITERREDVTRYEVPALVETDLWARAQERTTAAHKARGGASRLSREPRYLLIGHAVCDHCGGPLAAQRSSTGSGTRRRLLLTYRCLWRADRGEAVCPVRYVRPQAPINCGIIEGIAGACDPSEVRAAVARARELLRPEVIDARRDELVAIERDAAGRVARLAAALEHGAGDVAPVVERLRAATIERDRARAQLAALAAPARVHDLGAERHLVALASDVAGSLRAALGLAEAGDVETLRYLRGVLRACLCGPLRARLDGDGLLTVRGHAAPGRLLGWSEAGSDVGSDGDPNGTESHPTFWRVAITGAA